MSHPYLVYETDLFTYDIRLVRQGDNLILLHAETGETLEVFGGYFGPGWLVQELHFHWSEGVILRRAEVDETLANGGVVPSGVNLWDSGTLVGTSYQDILAATQAGTVLLGHGGNDSLYGMRGSDAGGVVFDGGEGDDMFLGSAGGDVYRYDRGDGTDRIADRIGDQGPDVAAAFASDPADARFLDRLEFGTGILPGQVTAARAGADLRLTVAGAQGDVLIFVDWFAHGMGSKIEEFAFQDGTVWLASEVDARLNVYTAGLTRSGAGWVGGTQYNDTLTAIGYGTVLQGGAGNDVLAAAVAGNVFDLTFESGRGNDIVQGSYARDAYRYALGDGHDLIRDDVRSMGADVAAFFAANPGTDTYQDRLEFGDGIGAADVAAERVQDDLVLHIGGSAGSITVDGWYDGTMFRKIEHFQFADGTQWLASDIDLMLGELSPGVSRSGAGTLVGSQYNDALMATGYGTRLEGGAANDTLIAGVNGGIFELTFVGGAGNDILTGSYARDVYHYGLGDGRDRIRDDVRAMGADIAAYFSANPGAASYQDQLVFGEGISASAVTGERVGEDLRLHIGGTGGSIDVQGWYDGTMFNKIESFAFSDGTTWLASDVDAMLGEWSNGKVASGGGTLTGSQYSDTLTATGYGTRLEGGAASDTLIAGVNGGIFDLTFVGGAGNDILTGSYARDVYHYGLGDGRDRIRDDVRAMGSDIAAYFAANPGEASYQDQLVFGSGIHAAAVTAERAGSDLRLHVGDSGGSIDVQGWFDGTIFNRIESFAFADGTTWLASDIDAKFSVTHVGVTRSGSGMLTGSQYLDTLTATGHGTRLEGGAGNDRLVASANGSVFDLEFIGGRGSDLILGSYARDVFHFARGDGSDWIIDDVRKMGPDVAAYFQANPDTATYQDKLVFGAGISPSQVRLNRVHEDLWLNLDGGQGQIRVQGWYDGTIFNKIESIEFADGSSWLASDVDRMLGQASPGIDRSGMGTLRGSQYDDTLQATGSDTRLEGGAGNDTLRAAYLGASNLTFVGGRGNDILLGSYNQDVYRYALGDGTDWLRAETSTYQDKLLFEAGIDPDMVARGREGHALVLNVGSGGIIFENWFQGSLNKIGLIGFADGTTWTAAMAEQGLA